MEKIDLTKMQSDEAYGCVYALFAKEFLIDSKNYEDFAELVQSRFDLTSMQWRYLLLMWNEKEEILS